MPGSPHTIGLAQVSSVSCPSPGNCTAGGYYETGSIPNENIQQAFVVSQVNGTWGQAEQVPGSAALNVGDGAQVFSVSCASAGNCSAVGIYTDAADTQLAFAVNETSGTWGLAQQVGSTDRYNDLVTVSCGSPGDCSAGGYLTDRSGHAQAVIASEKNGAWGGLREVRRSAALNTGGFAKVTSVSCASPGDCGAGGIYANNSGGQGLVVNEAARG